MASEDLTGSVDGTWHPPGSARAVGARFFRAADGRLGLTDLASEEPIPIDEGVTVSDRIAGAPRRVTFADGSVFVTRDDDAREALFGARLTGSFFARVARLERPSVRLFVFGSLMVLAIVAAIRFGLPMAAKAAAMLTPHAVNVQIGNATLASIDRLMLAPSELDGARCDHFRGEVKRMAGGIGLGDRVSLNCRKGQRVGANAFALPGGVLVLTDELVAETGDDADVVAVLAHELSHARNRHPEQRLWRSVGVGLTLGLLFGDAGTLVEEAASLGTFVLENSYSRDAEREADLGAIGLLGAVGIDAGHLVTALEKLHRKCGASCAGESWLSTHPGGESRQAYLCAAIGHSEAAAGLCNETD